MSTVSLALALLASAATPAAAQDPLNLGVLENEDIQVVQKRLYAKEGRMEMAAAVGVLPFDAYTIAPKLQISVGKHLSELVAWEVQLGGGYGLPTSTWRDLTGPVYGVVPEAYRYLASLTAGIQYAPVYAKMTWGSGRVFHHDVYFPVVAGVTTEQIVEEDLVGEGGSPLAFAPTLGAGLGIRVFLPSGRHVRIEVRDDFLLQSRASGAKALKQNVGITVGLGFLRQDS